VHTTIPGPLLRDRVIVLTVCSRHGRPQTHRIRFTAESSPPGWSYALIPLGMLFFWIVRALTRTRIEIPWPFCDSCRRRRRAVFALAALQMAAIVALLAHSTSYDNPRTGANIAALSLVPLVTGYVTLHWSRFQVIARITLSRESQEILVSRPAAEFAAEANAALLAVHDAALLQQHPVPQHPVPQQTAPPVAAASTTGWQQPG
jgi:hypothetical protein